MLRDALPADVVEVLDRHEHAETYDDPEYQRAEQVYFYRGPSPRAELERMRVERAPDVYRRCRGRTSGP